LVDRLFLRRQQIEQQRRKSAPAQELGDLTVAAAESAAAAAVREDDEPTATSTASSAALFFMASSRGQSYRDEREATSSQREVFTNERRNAATVVPVDDAKTPMDRGSRKTLGERPFESGAKFLACAPKISGPALTSGDINPFSKVTAGRDIERWSNRRQYLRCLDRLVLGLRWCGNDPVIPTSPGR
jgi:hypothetical protein